MNVKYRVTLSDQERAALEALVARGPERARGQARAAPARRQRGRREHQRGHDLPDQALLRRGGAGRRPARRAPPRRAPQALGQGGGVVGRDRVQRAPRGPCALDPGPAGRGDGALDRARRPERRDGAAASGGEQAQALAAEDVVRSEDQRRVRRAHGGRARSVRGARRSEAPGALLRREPQAVDRRSPRTATGRAGRARAGRLRVRAQRHHEPVRGVRRAQGLCVTSTSRISERRTSSPTR